MRMRFNPSSSCSARTMRLVALWSLLAVTGCQDDGSARVEVPVPTGERMSDREAVTAAIQAAGPGEVVEFGAGTYLIGSEAFLVGTPGIALRGHPDGTTLVGCTEDERAAMPIEEYWERCNGFVLAGEAQRVTGLRFEGFSDALSIRHPSAVDLPERDVPYAGGQVIEGNVFQDVTSFSIRLDADSVVLVRDNVFRNTWHALATGGRNIHFVDNDIAVPEPDRVSNGYPGGAIGIRPDRNGVCESIVVEGNRVEGHTEGVMIALFPQDAAGSSCSDIVVRNNEISMRPVHFPFADPRPGFEDAEDRGGKLAIAPAILVRNVQPLVGAGVLEWPAFWIPEGGWPAELADGRIHDITVEGNRITGAVGIGIELVDVEDVRVLDNEIEVRPAATPAEIEGLRLGGNGGPGVWIELGLLETVNGTAVWVSEGSEGVEIRYPGGR